MRVTRHIVACDGIGFLPTPGEITLDEFAMHLTRAGRPKFCFLPTAGGDNPEASEHFYRSFPPYWAIAVGTTA